MTLHHFYSYLQLKSTIFLDPFQLIDCSQYGTHKQAPFTIQVSAQVLAMIDIHAHLSNSEVIGLLGGHFDEERRSLNIIFPIPCVAESMLIIIFQIYYYYFFFLNLATTGTQCELDPMSEVSAR